MCRLLIFLLVVACIAMRADAFGESNAQGFPDYPVRAFHELVNHFRSGPENYKNTYTGTSFPSTYAASDAFFQSTSAQGYLSPVTYSFQLQNTSTRHTWEMINTSRFVRTGLGGLSLTNDIKLNYTCGLYVDRVIVGGSMDPMLAFNRLLYDLAQASCASAQAIKNSAMGALGGYVNPTAQYWTVDWGSSECDWGLTWTNYIASGSHISYNGNTVFLATVSSQNGHETSVTGSVVVDGVSYVMTYEYGSAFNFGSYSASITPGVSCRKYYFSFLFDANVYRYPDTGYLMTYGEGGCSSSFSTVAYPLLPPPSGTYYVVNNGVLANLWTCGGASVSYNGVPSLSLSVSTGSSMGHGHSGNVNFASYTYGLVNIAASSAATYRWSCGGGTYYSISVTTSWQSVKLAPSSFCSTLTLVNSVPFQNMGGSTNTLYINSLRFEP